MQSRKRFTRLLKILGKMLLIFIFLLVALVGIIHLPIVQNQITRRVVTYLSERLETQVKIDNIRFSLLGSLSINDTELWDPEHNSLLSVERIHLETSWTDILTGRYVFDEIKIEGMNGRLVEDDNGYNIQFIIDAFRSNDVADTTPTLLEVDFNKIILERIQFEFVSLLSGLTLKTNLEKFETDKVEYKSNANLIKAGDVLFENSTVSILLKDVEQKITLPDTSNTTFVFAPDFGLGIGFDLKSLDIRNGAFSFHQREVMTTPRFDPEHVDLKALQVSAQDILMTADTLAVQFNHLIVEMPGIDKTEASGKMAMNKEMVNLSGFKMNSGANILQAELHGFRGVNTLTSKPGLGIDVNIEAHIQPADFSYFLEEETQTMLSNFPYIDIDLKGKYGESIGVIELLEINSAQSHVQANGNIHHLTSMENLSWEGLNITSSMGSDVQNWLKTFVDDFQIPTSLQLDVKTSGNLREMILDARLNTNKGLLLAKGTVKPSKENMFIDLDLDGQQIRAGEILELDWLQNTDFAIKAKGSAGDYMKLDISGDVHSIGLMNHSIKEIRIDGIVSADSLIGDIRVGDPLYKTSANVVIDLNDPMHILSDAILDDFHAGQLLGTDSSLTISGHIHSDLMMDESIIQGKIKGDTVLITNQFGPYALDSLSVVAYMSPDSGMIQYMADEDIGSLSTNFDLQELPLIMEAKLDRIMHSPVTYTLPPGNRKLLFDIKMSHPGPIMLAGLKVDTFSGLDIRGEYDEKAGTIIAQGSAGKFSAYGTSLDTTQFDIKGNGDTIVMQMKASNLVYDSVALGNLVFDASTQGDTAITTLQLSRDTISLVDMKARVFPTDSVVIIYPDQLVALGNEYQLNENNRVLIRDGQVAWDQFMMTRKDMHLKLDGDMKAMEADFSNMDLTLLNPILSPDTGFIDSGKLTGKASYTEGKKLVLDAQIDSLILYHSLPLQVNIHASNEGNEVPFQFQLSNATNKVEANGFYYMDSEKINADLSLDVQQLEIFSFLLTDILDELEGEASGEAKITGTLENPNVNGKIRLKDVDITTANPKLSFRIKEDVIIVENSKFNLDQLTLYDKQNHVLNVTGFVEVKSGSDYAYDLKFVTDKFTLLNVPPSSKDQVRGRLVLAADMKMEGDEKDTHVEAGITVMDTTSLIYVYKSDEADMLQTEGIVEFVDPGTLSDTTTLDDSQTLYDSLVSSLPEFILKSNLKIEDGAKIRVVTNEQSGDYFEATGSADLDINYDRTGNMQISGAYTISRGVYRISFYDLVRRNFKILPGSSVKWSGTPETGVIQVNAVDTVTANSIGLVGNEVGENEKSVYKRPLDYIIGIGIKGTLESPVVSFSLDLPPEDRASYPVLANKLDRLKNPEFQTELNKQIFGLLVLGGFLPEATGEEINSNQIAATALYNSVNSILASQLNRFAGQYIKGVNIDVGFQSYTDYSSPGGKMQSTMDFRVSKSILNERLSFEVGGDFDISTDQSGANTGDNYRGDAAIIYDLTGRGDKQLKFFNNETYDIIYQEIRNTGISLIFIREFNKGDKIVKKEK